MSEREKYEQVRMNAPKQPSARTVRVRLIPASYLIPRTRPENSL